MIMTSPHMPLHMNSALGDSGMQKHMKEGLHMDIRDSQRWKIVSWVKGQKVRAWCVWRGEEARRSHMQRLDKQDAHEAQLSAAELGVAQGTLDSSARGGSLRS